MYAVTNPVQGRRLDINQMTEEQQLLSIIKCLPGKLDADNCIWLPVSIHLLDTAGVMAWLVESWIPNQFKNIFADSCDPDQFKPFCCFLAMVHDIGKMTPVFSRKMLEYGHGSSEFGLICDGMDIPEQTFFGADGKESPHALASESILMSMNCPDSVSVIAGSHHGKPQMRKASKYQMSTYHKNYFGSYQPNDIWNTIWNEWLKYSLLRNEFSDVSDLPDVAQNEQMLLAGLLSTADWIASNTQCFPLIPIDSDGSDIDLRKRISTGMKKLNLPKCWHPHQATVSDEDFMDRFGFTPNRMQQDVINIVENCNCPGLIIIEAPMGSGKTEAALSAAEIVATKKKSGGLFFGMPTQATANGIFPRLEKWAESQSKEMKHAIQLAHGASELNDLYESLSVTSNENCSDSGLIVHEWLSGFRRTMMSEFVVGTVDQMLMSSLKQKYVMLRHFALAGKVIVLDEIHSYDACMNEYLKTTLRWLGSYKTPVIMLSATLPTRTRNALVEAYTGKPTDSLSNSKNDYPVITWTDGNAVTQKPLPEVGDTRVVNIQRETDNDIVGLIDSKMENGGCVGIIVNTIYRAQEMARKMMEGFPDKTIKLVHSGFTFEDRAAKEKNIIERTGRDSTYEDRNNLIVIGTQVLEQSLDIDFDFMITDLCPIDLLLQRIGRLHRHNRKRPAGLEQAECVVLNATDNLDSGSIAVYGSWLLLRTKEVLPDKIVLPDSISELVETVYSEPDADILKNEIMKKSYNSYITKIRKEQNDAFVYMLANPSTNTTRKKTIRGMIDIDVDNIGGDAISKDIKTYATVRGGAPSIQVIAMMVEDNKACFVPWSKEKGYIQLDRPPDEHEHKQMAKQRLTLPHFVYRKFSIDDVINDLSEKNDQFVYDQKKSNKLYGNLILPLNSNCEVNICGRTFKYDSIFGVMEVETEE